MRQTSDQLINFRALASEVSNLKQELQKKDTIIRGLLADVGNLKVKPDPAPATATPGSASGVVVLVDFGASFTHFAQTVVTGEAWVTLGMSIVATPYDNTGVAEELALLSFQPVITDIVPGDGFTLSVYTPVEAKGEYYFSCIGV